MWASCLVGAKESTKNGNPIVAPRMLSSSSSTPNTASTGQRGALPEGWKRTHSPHSPHRETRNQPQISDTVPVAQLYRSCISVYRHRLKVNATLGSDEQLNSAPAEGQWSATGSNVLPKSRMQRTKTVLGPICRLDPTLDHALAVWSSSNPPSPHNGFTFHL